MNDEAILFEREFGQGLPRFARNDGVRAGRYSGGTGAARQNFATAAKRRKGKGGLAYG
ncbi:hypothetical protein [uncultured Fibrobacter sp.]|uniref:hypothetical protein n=1 Tax=uncultured Fibrobacter sp. TaxID=261512 RepID=UPI0028057096|nr:hypothetical protein [uncultured Fibrobacter sp.]